MEKKLKAINAHKNKVENNQENIHPLTPGFQGGRGHGGRRSRSAFAIV